ncbi:hypothetical protein GCM10028818_23540 [Spirosoma horti]
MKTSFPFLPTLICLLLLWVVSCKKDPDPAPTTGGTTTPGSTTTKSAAKDIKTFSLAALSPAVTGNIDATAKTISATVATGTDVTKLVPTITLSDKATVSPATGVAQDFSKAVTYTVTAEDGSTQAYTANVTVNKPVVSSISTADPSPVAEDSPDAIYFGSSQVLSAIDLATQSKKWSLFTQTDFGRPTVKNGIVYAGSGSSLLAFDAVTGASKWKASVKDGSYYGVDAPKVADGMVYYNSNGTVYAFDALTGDKKWEFDAGQGKFGNINLANGIVYTNGYSKTYALDAKTGVKKWELNQAMSISEYNGVLFGLNVSGIYSLDAASGSQKWFFPSSSQFGMYPLTISQGIVYSADGNTAVGGQFFAIDAMTGAVKWKVQAEGGKAFNGTPIAYNGIVYAYNSNKKIYAYDAATGAKKWEFDTNSEFSGLVVAKGVLYAGAYSGKSYALDATTGVMKWALSENLSGRYPCIVSGKKLYEVLKSIKE